MQVETAMNDLRDGLLMEWRWQRTRQIQGAFLAQRAPYSHAK